MTFVSAAILAASIGAFSTLAQVVLLREVMVVLAGNELSIATSLGAWLFGVGIGAVLGGVAARRRPEWWVYASICLLAIVAPASAIGIRSALSILGAVPGALVPPAETLGLCLLLLSPTSLGVGFSFAPLAKTAAGGGDVKRSAAWIYAIEAAGSVAAGTLFTFLFAGIVAPFVVLVASGICMTAAATSIALFRRRVALSLPVAVILIGGLIGLTFGFVGSVEEWSSDVRWRAQGAVGTRIDQVDSRYQHLDLAVNEGQFDVYSNGSPIYSFPDPWGRASLVHMAMAQTVSERRRVLLIGNGVADRVAAVLQHQPGEVHYVTSDAAEIDLVAPFLSERDRSAMNDQRTKVFLDDGRRFVARASQGSYDLIVVEEPDPTTARSNRYFTTDFFSECRRALSPDGVLTIRISGAATHLHDEIIAPSASVYQSLTSVFGQVALWPGPEIRMYAASAEGIVSHEPAVLAARWRERDPEGAIMSEHRFESVFDPALVSELDSRLGSVERLVNTDEHPMAYLYGLVLWDERARGLTEPSPLWTLRALEAWWCLVPLLLFALLRRFWPARSEKSHARDGLILVTSGGLCGLSLEIMLLLVFQNVSGSLYSALGLLVALFMMGLTVGVLACRKLLGGAELGRVRRWAVFVDISTVAVVLTTPLIAGSTQAWWLAGLWLVLAGLCTGAVFPPAVFLLARGLESKGGDTKAAGLADAADHLGACLGAVSIGLVLLPVTGLVGAAVVLLGVKAISLAGLVRRAR